jgi:hypothetical protein
MKIKRRAIATTEVKRLLTRVSVIRHRTCWNQPEILAGGLIDQFSMLTKAANCEAVAHRNINIHKHNNFIDFSLS